MATRTNTELKVFLDSATDSYDKYVDLADKSGTVFFDRNRRAVYAEGVLITSDVVDVKIEGSKLMVKKVGETTYTELADLAIPNVFVKFTENQGLTIAEQKAARANIGVKDAVNNLESTDTIAPLSANQGRVLNENKVDKVNGSRLMTDAEGTKLAGIQEEAQKNRNVVAIDTAVGDGDNNDAIVLTGNLVNKSKASSGEVGFSLSHRYDANDKRIYFFNSATAPTTGTTGHIFYIDTTDFVKDGMLANATYDNDTHTLTLVFNATATDSGVENIEVDLSKLVDVYKAGVGLILSNDTFQVNYGYGLTIDPEYQELTVDIGNGLKFGTDSKIVVDWTKAPVQSVNGQTGVVNIDVTPKVWKFED